MLPDQAADPELLAHYEGVIRKTASKYDPYTEEEYDDICQLFRIKAWRALLSFDPAKLTSSPEDAEGLAEARDRYVFSCIKNQGKDLVKRVRRDWLFIEQIAPAGRTLHQDSGRDAFESRYLNVTHEEVFAAAEDTAPLIPSTLTEGEREIVVLLYLDFDYGEIASRLELERKQVATTVRGIREKMADWRPSSGEAPVDLPIAA